MSRIPDTGTCRTNQLALIRIQLYFNQHLPSKLQRVRCSLPAVISLDFSSNWQLNCLGGLKGVPRPRGTRQTKNYIFKQLQIFVRHSKFIYFYWNNSQQAAVIFFATQKKLTFNWEKFTLITYIKNQNQKQFQII